MSKGVGVIREKKDLTALAQRKRDCTEDVEEKGDFSVAHCNGRLLLQ